MAARILLPLCVLVLGVGLVVGRFGADWWDRATGSSRTPRPEALEQTWRALESGTADDLSARAAALDPTAMPTAAFRDEARLLQAIAAGDRAAVDRMATEGADRRLGAQALAWLIDTESDATRRGRYEARLRESHPSSWRVRKGTRVSPGQGRDR